METERCGYCDGTGDVIRADGEWLGPCPEGCPLPGTPPAPAPIAESVETVLHYGPRCRDCADEDGICPASGLPCDVGLRRKAINHILRALAYNAALSTPADKTVVEALEEASRYALRALRRDTDDAGDMLWEAEQRLDAALSLSRRNRNEGGR